MEFKDYYQTLGVARAATQDDLKRAYRRLARKYHPDVSTEPNAEERFKDVKEAYEVLKDPGKRAAYDRLGGRFQAGQEFRPPPDWDVGVEFGDAGAEGAAGFSDFFASLFGHAHPGFGGGRAAFRARGEHHHAKIEIDLGDAYRGATRAVTLQAPAVDAAGHVTLRSRTLNVRIPKGVIEGQRLRLPGQGAPGLGGGEPGDLYLEVRFRSHARYHAEGRDVYLEFPVTPWEAALGATVRVPTPAGPVEMKVPPGSQSGSQLRLAGRGIPGAAAGNLYVVLKVVLPSAKSERAQRLYQTMQQELAFDPRAGWETVYGH